MTARKDSTIAKRDMENFVTRIEDHDYTNLVTADMDEAREWIAEK